MVKLHIELIDRLNDAYGAISGAIDAIADRDGTGDELFDRLVEARSAVNVAAERLQGDADTYGEMAHNGLA